MLSTRRAVWFGSGEMQSMSMAEAIFATLPFVFETSVGASVEA